MFRSGEGAASLLAVSELLNVTSMFCLTKTLSFILRGYLCVHHNHNREVLIILPLAVNCSENITRLLYYISDRNVQEIHKWKGIEVDSNSNCFYGDDVAQNCLGGRTALVINCASL